MNSGDKLGFRWLCCKKILFKRTIFMKICEIFSKIMYDEKMFNERCMIMMNQRDTKTSA